MPRDGIYNSNGADWGISKKWLLNFPERNTSLQGDDLTRYAAEILENERRERALATAKRETEFSR